MSAPDMMIKLLTEPGLFANNLSAGIKILILLNL